mmetsp:Transcript_25870/g.85206  ORF Transcript_25870/g.85206 Transcript_25870/m.85206 type:complete len:116 (-) Transcript_25870:597-944(-)
MLSFTFFSFCLLSLLLSKHLATSLPYRLRFHALLFYRLLVRMLGPSLVLFSPCSLGVLRRSAMSSDVGKQTSRSLGINDYEESYLIGPARLRRLHRQQSDSAVVSALHYSHSFSL